MGEKSRCERKERDKVSQIAPPTRKPKKKTWLQRFKDNIGAIERTPYPATLLKDYTDIDQYRDALEAAATAMCIVWQPNPKYRKTVKETMELAAPIGKDEYEMVRALFVERASDLGEFSKNQKSYLKALEMVATLHKDFQKEARSVIHFMRTFLRTDYPTLIILREELEDMRFEMDVLKHQQKTCKEPQSIPTKAAEIETATIAYQNKLQEVVQIVEDFPDSREKHVKELTEWATICKRFHERTASVISTINQ